MYSLILDLSPLHFLETQRRPINLGWLLLLGFFQGSHAFQNVMGIVASQATYEEHQIRNPTSYIQEMNLRKYLVDAYGRSYIGWLVWH